MTVVQFGKGEGASADSKASTRMLLLKTAFPVRLETGFQLTECRHPIGQFKSHYNSFFTDFQNTVL